MCPRALLLVVRDSRLRDRKERETLNQKGASFFANWPLATQQRPVINPTEHERKKKKIDRGIHFFLRKRNRGNVKFDDCLQFYLFSIQEAVV